MCMYVTREPGLTQAVGAGVSVPDEAERPSQALPESGNQHRASSTS